MADLDGLRRKLAALLRLTVANGCTEAEAMAAARAAQGLRDAYGIEPAEDDGLGEHAMPPRPRGPTDELWPVVAGMNGCRTALRRDGRRWVRVYWGRASGLAIAEFLHVVLARAIADETAAFRGSDAYRRRRTTRTRNAAVRAFQAGLVHSLVRQVVDLAWTARDRGDPAETAALIQAPLAEVDAWLKGRGVALGPLRPLDEAGRRFDRDRLHGRARGRQIAINAPVAGAAGAAVPALADRREG